MKKKIVAFMLISIMSLSFAVPAMAVEASVETPKDTAVQQEITPFTEMTRIYFRTVNGQLQARVWSMTNGRWLTEWTNM